MSAWTVKDADGCPMRSFLSEAAALEWHQRETDRLTPLPIRNARLPLAIAEEPS